MPADNSKQRTQFHLQMEQAIAMANREVMKSAKLPPVNQDSVLPLAISVARLRSEYLKEALMIGSSGGNDSPVEAELIKLGKHRQAYEEGVAAFEVLMRAIERGYIELDI
ncbi:MAG: hypothetical protein VW802_03960 [Rhodospirillaceae bacterium]